MKTGRDVMKIKRYLSFSERKSKTPRILSVTVVSRPPSRKAHTTTRVVANKITSTASVSFLVITSFVKHLAGTTTIVGSHSALDFSFQGTANNTFPTSVAKVSVAAWRDTLGQDAC
jgi:hypothetical protein